MSDQDSYVPDSVISSVIEKFIERGKVGFKKYGTTLDRDDLSVYDWINHAQEEVMDYILYLERLKKKINTIICDEIKNGEIARIEMNKDDFVEKHVR